MCPPACQSTGLTRCELCRTKTGYSRSTMFTRARLHLTLLYAALLSITVVLVAGAVGLLSVQEARRTDDSELKLRAEAILAALPPGPPPNPSGPASRGQGPPPPHLESAGLLEYILPVVGGQLMAPSPGSIIGLPDLVAANEAMQTGRAVYRTITANGSQVRVYALPDVRLGAVNGVVKVARSQYFVNAAIGDIVLIALLAGGAGLLLSGAAGYWLAGRTLRPIAATLERQRNFAADASHELRTPPGGVPGRDRRHYRGDPASEPAGGRPADAGARRSGPRRDPARAGRSLGRGADRRTPVHARGRRQGARSAHRRRAGRDGRRRSRSAAAACGD